MSLQVTLVLVIVVLFYGVNEEVYPLVNYQEILLKAHTGSSGANARKLAIIKKETVAVAKLLRDIRITTPQQQTSLIEMANSFSAAFSIAVYTLNSVIPYTTKDEGNKLLVWVAKIKSAWANDIQTAISNEPKKLKEKLIQILEETNLAVILFEKDFKTHDPFIINQLNRKHDDIVVLLYRVKHQTEFFLSSNKDLKVAVERSTARLIAVVETLPNKKDVSGISNNLERSLPKLIGKLKNWVEINPNIGKDMDVITESIDGLSSLYGDLNSGSKRRLSISSSKRQLLKSLKRFSKELTALARLNVIDSNGADFITYCMYEGIGMASGYFSIITNTF